jgi:hypothetical protein
MGFFASLSLPNSQCGRPRLSRGVSYRCSALSGVAIAAIASRHAFNGTCSAIGTIVSSGTLRILTINPFWIAASIPAFKAGH